MNSLSAVDSERQRQMFDTFLQRMKHLSRDKGFNDVEDCPELNPDVIVTSGDQTLMFEPQNERASTLLRRCCGLSAEILDVREKVCVHPCESRKIIEALSAAGLKVAN
ncbi:MAG: hypothetical protein ACREFE_11320 [Limisphaerales bacterium]